MNAVLEERTIDEAPHPMTVVVPVTNEMIQGVKTVGAVIEAEAWEIDSADMAQLAAEQRKAWAKRIDQVKELQADFMEPAKTFMASIKDKCQKWFAPAMLDLEAGRDILGRKLLAWDAQEKARLEAERQRIEAEQRKIRQEAEAKAAAERARAEEQAREQRRREQEALEAQRRAIAEGNAKAAAKAAADAAKANEAAQAAIENGQARAQQAELEAAARASAAPIPEAVKIEGSSVKANWVAVLADGYTEDRALLEICKAIAAGRADLMALVKVDTAARGPLAMLAKGLKKAMNVPGYIARDIPTLAGARK